MGRHPKTFSFNDNKDCRGETIMIEVDSSVDSHKCVVELQNSKTFHSQ